MDGKIRVLYFWATWCAPCALVRKALIEMQSKYPGRFEIAAISPEAKDEIESYLLKTYQKGPTPFFYGVSFGKKRSGSYEDYPYLPYAYVFLNGETIWKGLAGYPKGEIENLLESLATGKWNRDQEKIRAEKLAVIDGEISALDFELGTLNDREEKLYQKRIQVFSKKIEIDRSRYIPWQQRHQAMLRLASVYADRKADVEKLNALKKEAEESFRAARSVFSHSRDELTFLGSDLVEVHDRRLDFQDLGTQILEQAASLPDDGQYGAYTLMDLGLARLNAGRFAEAERLLSSGLEQARHMGVADKNLASEVVALDKAKKSSPMECSSSLTCLYASLRSFF